MPRTRKTDKHLPPNVYWIDYDKHRKNKKNSNKPKGAYYFRPSLVENGKKKRKNIFLDYTYHKAMARWSELTEPGFMTDMRMNSIFTRYMTEVAPNKSPRSYKDNIYEMSYLRPFFGDMYIRDVKPTTIYRYLDERGKTAKIRANREVALLSHVFTNCIRWGYIETNPCANVERFPEEPRTRYVEDWEFIAIRTWAKLPPLLRALMGFMYISGRRRCELLPVQKNRDVTEEGIKLYDTKGKEWFLLEWSDALRVVYQELLDVKRQVGSVYLIANNQGKMYTENGIKAMWYRWIRKAIAENIIEEPFTMHDVRAKVSSDAPTDEAACALLKHSSLQITRRHYRRQLRRVQPITQEQFNKLTNKNKLGG